MNEQNPKPVNRAHRAARKATAAQGRGDHRSALELYKLSNDMLRLAISELPERNDVLSVQQSLLLQIGENEWKMRVIHLKDLAAFRKMIGEPDEIVEESPHQRNTNHIFFDPTRSSDDEQSEEDEEDGVVLINQNHFRSPFYRPGISRLRSSVTRHDRLSECLSHLEGDEPRLLHRSPSLPENSQLPHLMGRRLPKSNEQIEEERATLQLHRQQWANHRIL